MAASGRNDSLSLLMDQLRTTSYTIGSTHWIEVTHVNNPNSFYVRPTVFKKYLTTLETPGSRCDVSDIQLGNVVIFRSITNKFVRGKIIFIDKQELGIKLDLFAMDYGNIEKNEPVENVYKPLDPLADNVPSLVKHCQLELCRPNGGTWKERAIEAMKFYIGNERTKIIIQDVSEDLLTVTMYNSCPDDISTMLANLGDSNLGHKSNALNRFSAAPAPKQAYYLFPKRNVGDTLQVRLQSAISLTQFYVAEVNNFKKYLKERENVAYFARQAVAMKPEEMSIGKPVCVPTTTRYSYERAIIKHVDAENNKAMVQLVDWGDLIEVPIDYIKPIRESFLSTDVLAMLCSTDESQTWDNGLQRFLFPGFSFIIKIKSIGDSFKTPSVVYIYKT